jgi:hypothetical protein
MAFLGLVPSERTTGDRVRRGSITKTGNNRARRVPIEGAWTYRFSARISETLRGRLKDLPHRHPRHRLEGTGPAVRPLPSAHCQWQEDPCCDNGDCSRGCWLPVGNRSASCAPEAGPPEGLCNSELVSPIMSNILTLGARFCRQSLATEERPWRALGIDRSARPSRSMLPCDECGRLASSTSPYGEAHISGYPLVDLGKRQTNNGRCA